MFGRKARKQEGLEHRVTYLEERLVLQLLLNAEMSVRLDAFERQQDKLGNDLRELRHTPKS